MIALDAYNYVPRRTDQILFDANIWIALLKAGLNASGSQRVYASFYARCKQQNAKIFIAFPVLSEVINRQLRNKYETVRQRYPDYKKHFRPSIDFDLEYQQIKTFFEDKIRTGAAYVSDGFAELQPVDVFTQPNAADWNDKIIAHIAKSNGYKLLTHDGDFAVHAHDIRLITANQNLILAT